MRLPTVSASIAIAIALVAAPALAETLTDQAARVTIEVPDGWTANPHGTSVTISDHAGEVAAELMVVKAGTIDHASRIVGEELAKKIDKITVEQDEKVDINGMKGEIIGGDGRLHGTNIDWMVAVVDTPSTDKDLMILVIAEDDKLARHKKELQFLFRHLRPMN